MYPPHPHDTVLEEVLHLSVSRVHLEHCMGWVPDVVRLGFLENMIELYKYVRSEIPPKASTLLDTEPEEIRDVS